MQQVLQLELESVDGNGMTQFRESRVVRTLAALPLAAATLLAVGVVASSSGCSGRAEEEAKAQQAFDRFQTALFERDVEGIRWLLTRGSWPVIDHLPWDRIQTQEPLEFVEMEKAQGRFELTVRDPNTDGTLATYVVVRENGRFRVDLLETTTFHHKKENLPGGSTRIEPYALSPDEIGEITAREASMIR